MVVSTSTASLDLVDKLLCQPKGYAVVRIDGSVSVDDRQVVVSGAGIVRACKPSSRPHGDVVIAAGPLVAALHHACQE